MSKLRELYQEMIIDHGRSPRNFCEAPEANHRHEGYNPLCGDRLTVYVCEKNGVIEKITFKGCGCAISVASASLMTEVLKGKTIEEAKNLFETFHQLMIEGNERVASEKLGKLTVLAGVSEFPVRVKCATLAWHTAIAALDNKTKPTCTE